MTTLRCENCGCALDPSAPACSACGVPAASVGALGARRYDAGPAPRGSYDIVLGASEALAATFKLWSENLARLAVLGFVPYALMVPLMGAGMFLAFTPDALSHFGDLDAAWPMLAAAGTAVGALFMVLTLASTAACIHLVDEKTQGVHVSAPAALLASLKHVGWLFCGWLVLGGLAALGVAAPMVPLAIAMSETDWSIAMLAVPALAITAGAFVLAARLLPLLPVIVVEDTDIFTAMSRSWQLTSGRTGRVVLAALLFGLAWFGVSMAVGMVGIIPILGAFVQIGINAILVPLAYVFPFVIYAGCMRETASK